MGEPVVIGGENLPSPVRVGLTDLHNIGGASGPPGPPGSGTTGMHCILKYWLTDQQINEKKINRKDEFY